METLAWWGALTLVWWASLTTAGTAELVTGAVLALPAALAGTAARRALGTAWRPSGSWLRWAARLPGTLLRDGVRVLFTRPKPTERKTTVKGDVAVAAFLVNTTPGTVVVDADQHSVTVHALGAKQSGLERAVGR